jgi:hypothetical protein
MMNGREKSDSCIVPAKPVNPASRRRSGVMVNPTRARGGKPRKQPRANLESHAPEALATGSRWREGSWPRGTRSSKPRPGRRAGLARAVRWTVCVTRPGRTGPLVCPSASPPLPEVRARWGSSARRVLCGGRPVRAVPTATTYGLVRKDMVDQVSGRLDHAPSIARGANGPSFTGERDQEVMATIGAARACKTMGQNSTG